MPILYFLQSISVTIGIDLTSIAWLQDPLEWCSSSAEVWDFQVVAASVKGPKLPVGIGASLCQCHKTSLFITTPSKHKLEQEY
jgi:hypothetical protein